MRECLTIRDWNDSDVAQIRDLHAQMAPGYALPAEFGPLFMVRKAIADENGRIVVAATVKLTSEGYIFLNSDFSAWERAKCAKILIDECRKEAKAAGLEDCSAFVPPKAEGLFEKVLKRFGWYRSEWPVWSTLL